MRYYILLLVVIAFAFSSNGQELDTNISSVPPDDTVYAKYLIQKINEKSYHSLNNSDGSRSVFIIVPENAKSGDTLVQTLVWDGMRGIFLQANREADMAKQGIQDLKGVIMQLDSLYSDPKDTNN